MSEPERRGMRVHVCPRCGMRMPDFAIYRDAHNERCPPAEEPK